MKKYLKVLISIIIFTTVLISCASVNIKEIDKEQAMLTVGLTSSYFVLRNNPGYVRKVEQASNLALTMLDSDKVDVALLIGKIIEFAEEMLNDASFSKEVEKIKIVLPIFKEMVQLDLKIKENNTYAVNMTRAFLSGVVKAVEILKGERNAV
jgi:hypothetical protein